MGLGNGKQSTFMNDFFTGLIEFSEPFFPHFLNFFRPIFESTEEKLLDRYGRFSFIF